MGWTPNLAFTISHGKKFQVARRLIQQAFNRQKIEEYSHIQTREAHRLALDLLERPDGREAMLSRLVLKSLPSSIKLAQIECLRPF